MTPTPAVVPYTDLRYVELLPVVARLKEQLEQTQADLTEANAAAEYSADIAGRRAAAINSATAILLDSLKP